MPIRNVDGNWTRNDHEKATILANHLSTVCLNQLQQTSVHMKKQKFDMI